MNGLRRELAARGIRGRLAARIEAELDDHLACDPQARLGEPREIAERFAVELRGVRTRRASLGTFGALVAAALFLFILARNGSRGPAVGLGILAFGQIAFVAGTLAVWRALRGRSAGDFRVAQRRATVGLVAGAGVLICIAPVGLAGLPLLAVAAGATRRAAALTPAEPAKGLSADFGPQARLVLLALGLIAVAGVAYQGVAFEGSGWEGLIRGAIEAGGLTAGVAVLRAPLALRA